MGGPQLEPARHRLLQLHRRPASIGMDHHAPLRLSPATARAINPKLSPGTRTQPIGPAGVADPFPSSREPSTNSTRGIRNHTHSHIRNTAPASKGHTACTLHTDTDTGKASSHIRTDDSRATPSTGAKTAKPAGSGRT